MVGWALVGHMREGSVEKEIGGCCLSAFTVPEF